MYSSKKGPMAGVGVPTMAFPDAGRILKGLLRSRLAKRKHYSLDERLREGYS